MILRRLLAKLVHAAFDEARCHPNFLQTFYNTPVVFKYIMALPAERQREGRTVSTKSIMFVFELVS